MVILFVFLFFFVVDGSGNSKEKKSLYSIQFFTLFSNISLFLFYITTEITKECVTEFDCYKKYVMHADRKMECIEAKCYTVRSEVKYISLAYLKHKYLFFFLS